MDERQQKITEGAGLTESRLNQDFIDWLNKWGPRILTLVLVVLIIYVANDWWRSRQLESRDQAFFQLEQARISGSPDALLAVARDHDGRGAVAELATIEAADILLQAARRGVTPGGSIAIEDDLLSEEEQRDMYERAGDLYEQAFLATRADTGRPSQRISARWGMAAVAISLREWDEAAEALEDVARFAEEANMDRIAAVARERLENLDELKSAPPLLPEAEIATTTPRDPAAFGAAPSPIVTPQGEPRPGSNLLGPPTPLAPGDEERTIETQNPVEIPSEQIDPPPMPPVEGETTGEGSSEETGSEEPAPAEPPATEEEPPAESGEGEEAPPPSLP